MQPHKTMGYTDSPDSKVHGTNMGPIWGRQDPGGPHVDPMNFVIWDIPMPQIHRRFSEAAAEGMDGHPEK